MSEQNKTKSNTTTTAAVNDIIQQDKTTEHQNTDDRNVLAQNLEDKNMTMDNKSPNSTTTSDMDQGTDGGKKIKETQFQNEDFKKVKQLDTPLVMKKDPKNDCKSHPQQTTCEKKRKEEFNEGNGTIVDQPDPTSAVTSMPLITNKTLAQDGKEKTDTPFNQPSESKNRNDDAKTDKFSDRDAQGGKYVMSIL